MKTIETLIKEKECSGCEACIHICPQHVIEVGVDKEGFTIPIIADVERCVDCGQCIKVCQVHQRRDVSKDEENNPESFVAQSRDVKNSKRSSSGGAFWTIARWWIEEQHGVVFGAAFEINHVVCHVAVDNIQDLRQLQGSKYVQSHIGDAYIKVRQYLLAGTPVLFSGTPCQVQGLRLFLRKKYEKLLTIDLICHGVTSPVFLCEYVKKVEKQKKKICESIRFRWKNPFFKSGSSFYMMMKMNRGLNIVRAGKNDPYMNVYLSGYAFRESCYRCQFACPHRVGDITIGDCDSHRDYPDFHAVESNSTILLNTPRSIASWKESLNKLFDSTKMNLASEIECNKQLRAPFRRPDIRENIYEQLLEMSLEQLDAQYGLKKNSLSNIKTRILLYIPTTVINLVIRLRHGK